VAMDIATNRLRDKTQHTERNMDVMLQSHRTAKQTSNQRRTVIWL